MKEEVTEELIEYCKNYIGTIQEEREYYSYIFDDNGHMLIQILEVKMKDYDNIRKDLYLFIEKSINKSKGIDSDINCSTFSRFEYDKTSQKIKIFSKGIYLFDILLRGWGSIQYLKFKKYKPEQIQDTIGFVICDILNNELKIQNKFI